MGAFVVVVNRPGFLPESEPIECETHEEAIAAALAEIAYHADFVVITGAIRDAWRDDLRRDGLVHFRTEPTPDDDGLYGDEPGPLMVCEIMPTAEVDA